MNGLIDFHCHLDDEAFDEDRHEIVRSCMEQGYEGLVVLADPFNETSVLNTLDLMERYPIVRGMCAAHPHAAQKYGPEVEARTRRILDHDGCIGLGETGLDYFYDLSPRDIQRRVFARQIELAIEYGLPLIIHSRQAESDVLSLLDEKAFNGPVVFHCYTGSLRHARQILERGGYLSFSGIITFPKAEELRDVLRLTPLDRMFIETDSPYLAPVPERGKRNNPLFLQHTVRKAAELKGLTESALIESIRKNYEHLFV